MNSKDKNIDKIVSAIFKQLEGGLVPWVKPWEHWKSWSYGTGKDYTGINALNLGGGEMITFKQCKEAGGTVKKGAKSEKCVFYTEYKHYLKNGETAPVTYSDEKGDYCYKKCLKYYNVFNVADDTDLEPKQTKNLKSHSWDSHNKADQIFSEYIARKNVDVFHGSNRAYNAQNLLFNQIVLPKREQFKSAGGYYGTAFHEAIHSTAITLDRDTSGKKGSKKYAREELVAEIGSAYIMSYLGMESEIENSASYCAGWSKNLADDKAAILYAAPKAIEAAEYILRTAGETL